MIATETVLILGAGVSKPYGYPTGKELLRELYIETGRPRWKDLLMAHGHTESDIQAFRSELVGSQLPTIDAFLAHRPEFRELGHASIAISLLAKEDPGVFSDLGRREAGIYSLLFQRWAAPAWDDLGRNKLSIVTFNYDRSFEHFFFEALKHSYNKSDGAVADFLNTNAIPIIHVHGILGPLPWQSQTDGHEYAQLLNSGVSPHTIGERIAKAAKGIYTDTGSAPQEFIFAKERIRTARRIYFLGFGYDALNLERLGFAVLEFVDTDHRQNLLNKRYSAIHYRGSAMGLGQAEMQAIWERWRIWLPDSTSDAVKFLSDYAILN